MPPSEGPIHNSVLEGEAPLRYPRLHTHGGVTAAGAEVGAEVGTEVGTEVGAEVGAEVGP